MKIQTINITDVILVHGYCRKKLQLIFRFDQDLKDLFFTLWNNTQGFMIIKIKQII